MIFPVKEACVLVEIISWVLNQGSVDVNIVSGNEFEQISVWISN